MGAAEETLDLLIGFSRNPDTGQVLAELEAARRADARRRSNLVVLGALYRDHFLAVVKYLRSHGADAESAQDAAQEAFYRSASRLHEVSNPRAYLFMAAKRAYADAVALRQRQVSTDFTAITSGPGTSGAAESAEERVLLGELAADVRRTIEQLPQAEREIAVLYLLHDQTASEVAARTGYEYKAVRTVLPQVRHKIAMLLRGETAEEPQSTTTASRKLVNSLPPRQRQVFELDEQGLLPHQIAERLGITANNARVNLCHARKKLQPRATG